MTHTVSERSDDLKLLEVDSDIKNAWRGEWITTLLLYYYTRRILLGLN